MKARVSFVASSLPSKKAVEKAKDEAKANSKFNYVKGGAYGPQVLEVG
jgi:hypothetical protein